MLRDFGPTLAAEKLAKIYGLPIGVEALRHSVIDDNIWIRRRDRIKRIHQPRRQLAPYDVLHGSFARRVERTMTYSRKVRYERLIFTLGPNEISRTLAR